MVNMLSVAAPVVVAVRFTVLLAVKAPLMVVEPVSVLLPAIVCAPVARISRIEWNA